jgi:outer membrane lipoprotein-sorting protein
MAQIQPAPYPDDDEPGRGTGRGRKAARYAVPLAVAGMAAATITLVPALADSGDPSLPSLTAQQLLTKIAASDTQTLDGTVKVSTDLGLPAGLSGGPGSSLLGGAADPGAGGGKGSPAAPQAQLTRLLAGTHTLHVAADGPDRQKVSLIEPAAEYSVIHNGTQLWAYDSASDQAYHRTLAADAARTGAGHGPADAGESPLGAVPATPQEAARQVLKAADGVAAITVDGTSHVAGHDAYDLLITPRHADATTVGSIRIAVDAGTGVPLKFTLVPRGGGKAVFDIGFTRVSFAAPSASTFSFTPPKGVKVTEGDSTADHRHDAGAEARDGRAGGLAGVRPTVLGTGWDSIAVIRTPGGLADKTGKSGAAGPRQWPGATADGNDARRGHDRSGAGDASSLLNRFGTHVTGPFGSGTVFHTRLVNALLTDDGTLYVGAVSQSALTDAAAARAK